MTRKLLLKQCYLIDRLSSSNSHQNRFVLISFILVLNLLLIARFNFLMPSNTPEETRKAVPTPGMIAERPAPVVVKSHLPFYLLHPKLLDTSKVLSLNDVDIFKVNFSFIL